MCSLLGRSTSLDAFPNTSEQGLNLVPLSIDGMWNGFAQGASDWRALLPMAMGSYAYQLTKLTAARCLVPGFIARGLALTVEVSAFRSSSALLQHENLSSAFEMKAFTATTLDFFLLKGAGVLLQKQNLLLTHAGQSLAMVIGHDLGAAMHCVAKEEGSFVQRWMKAEMSNFQMLAGTRFMGLVTGHGLRVMERNLEIEFQARELRRSSSSTGDLIARQVSMAAESHRIEMDLSEIENKGWALERFQKLASDPSFFDETVLKFLDRVDPPAIETLRPRLLSSGKGEFDLFMVEMGLAGGTSLKALVFITDRFTSLANIYSDVAARDPEHEVAHRYGAYRNLGRVEGADRNLISFSVDFHPGIPVAEAIMPLIDLVGIPGIRTAALPRMRTDRLQYALSRLVRAGIIQEAEQEHILAAHAELNIESLLEVQRRMRELLFKFDASAIECYLRFYLKTGHAPGDPRRDNVIMNLQDEELTFRSIDYEHLMRGLSARKILLQFDVFEDKLPPGEPVLIGVRPWAWSFMEDKSGFFDAVVSAFPRREAGLVFLRQAYDECNAVRSVISHERNLWVQLARYLDAQGALPHPTSTSTHIVRSER